MQCFSLTERVRPGIIVNREEYPHIVAPEGCAVMVMLGQELTEFYEQLPPGILRLKRAEVGFEQGVMVLKPARGAPSQQALVRVETMGGVEGKVTLTAEAYEEDLRQGRVKKLRHRFPPAGVLALCTDEQTKQHNTGCEVIDLFIVMNPGASFRIERTGQLTDQNGESASPEMFIRWTGRALHAEVPRRFRPYDDRATAFAG
jgi:hypothetical protein